MAIEIKALNKSFSHAGKTTEILVDIDLTICDMKF